MKKYLIMPAAAVAAIALLAGGCTASEPDNALDINETITDNSGDNGNDTPDNNPTKDLCLKSYYINDWEYNINYNQSRLPISATIINRYKSYYKKFTFQYNNQEVSKISWNGKNESDDSETYESTEGNLSNLQFEDDLLKGCSYTETIIKYDIYDNQLQAETTSYTVAFNYDAEKHLTSIVANNKVYDQTWDENGDLRSIDSPWFGKSTVNYSSLENRWLQWEPTLPFMGFFQTFGWFGTAPKHFPTSISSTEGFLLPGYTFSSATLDYYIDYNGIIDRTRWRNSNSSDVEVNFQYE